ncbi:MAG: NADH:flavin oxidoreductase/NADH oxidase [Brachybacterium sp.]|nr:NADH:flavin oxidoreductase/NADH oxidase [Brachybacterium sp.]
MAARPLLLSPAPLGALELRNRIWLAPMCQYMAEARDGMPGDWHLMHLGARAAGGFGLVLTEATAVTADGRISPRDVGLWDEAHVAPWRRITDFVHAQGARIGVQLAHAGRKASTWPSLPAYARHRGTIPELAGGWRTIGPSDQPFPGLDAPDVLDEGRLAEVIAAFVAATQRADRAGFDAIELHFAHGYLVHEFLSPLVNTRTDAYGGSPQNRRRLAREVTTAVREAWPEDRALLVRISATDWIGGGWDIEQSIALVEELRPLGIDAVHVSSGGAVVADIAQVPDYQIGFARTIKERTGSPVAAVGLIADPEHAERVLADGSADFVAIGRAALREPGWPQRAAHELADPEASALYPEPYARGSW